MDGYSNYLKSERLRKNPRFCINHACLRLTRIGLARCKILLVETN